MVCSKQLRHRLLAPAERRTGKACGVNLNVCPLRPGSCFAIWLASPGSVSSFRSPARPSEGSGRAAAPIRTEASAEPSTTKETGPAGVRGRPCQLDRGPGQFRTRRPAGGTAALRPRDCSLSNLSRSVFFAPSKFGLVLRPSTWPFCSCSSVWQGYAERVLTSICVSRSKQG